ncbi:MAG: hypothetical protein WA840_15525 [Caulobacteraceae bacterium]
MYEEKAGRLTLVEAGRTYRATWKVVGLRVEVICDLGVEQANLGALAAAPAAVARETLRQMARRSNRPVKTTAERARFDIRDR